MSFADLLQGNATGGRRDVMNVKYGPSQGVVGQINTAVATFRRLVHSLGTARDTAELREKLHKTCFQIRQLIKATSIKLKQDSAADHRAETNFIKKIADAKLAKDFEAVVKDFQKVQRLALEKEKLLPAMNLSDVVSTSYPAGKINKTCNQCLCREKSSFQESERPSLSNVIEVRERRINEIQQQIADVNEIFNDLTILVNDQGIMIDDVGSDTETAHAATSQAKSSSSQASKSERMNSSMACMIIVILSILVLILIVVRQI